MVHGIISACAKKAPVQPSKCLWEFDRKRDKKHSNISKLIYYIVEWISMGSNVGSHGIQKCQKSSNFVAFEQIYTKVQDTLPPESTSHTISTGTIPGGGKQTLQHGEHGLELCRSTVAHLESPQNNQKNVEKYEKKDIAKNGPWVWLNNLIIPSQEFKLQTTNLPNHQGDSSRQDQPRSHDRLSQFLFLPDLMQFAYIYNISSLCRSLWRVKWHLK